MRLNAKLFLGIFLIAFVASGATGSYFYCQAREALFEAVRQQLRGAARAAALQINGDTLQSLTSPEQMSSKKYIDIQNQLSSFTRSNSEYLFAYTMRLEHGTVHFIVDSPTYQQTEDGSLRMAEQAEPIGKVYPNPNPDLLRGFVMPTSDQQPWKDKWGWTLSGYAPIYNSLGHAVGLVGIDMSLERIQSKLSAIRQAGMASLGIAAITALLLGWYFSKRIFKPLMQLQAALMRVSEGDYSQRLDVGSRDEMSSFADTFNTMVQELRERIWLKNSLGKVIGKEALNSILDNRLQLGGDVHSATIMVCDLRGFSQLSERLPPKLLVGLINDYFTAMVEIIQRHGGIVDKFVGDMILAVFGHPAPLEHEQRAALTAAREMIAKCDALNVSLQLGEDLRLENSIAVHTGLVLAGNIGSPDRMEYTVMGHPVNVAVRLERLTRDMGVRLAASLDFVRQLDIDHGLRHAGNHNLPGMHCAMEIFVAENARQNRTDKNPREKPKIPGTDCTE